MNLSARRSDLTGDAPDVTSAFLTNAQLMAHLDPSRLELPYVSRCLFFFSTACPPSGGGRVTTARPPTGAAGV